MAMPQYCYFAKGAKRPSHTTNMLIATKYNHMKLIADMNFLYEFFIDALNSFSFFNDLNVRQTEVAPAFSNFCQLLGSQLQNLLNLLNSD